MTHQDALANPTGLCFSVAVLMARWVPVLRLAPFFGLTNMANMIKNTIALALALGLLPVAFATAPSGLGFNAYTVAVTMKEAFLGLILGYMIAIFFWIAQSIGFMVDNQRGSAMAEIADPLSQEPSSPTGNLLFQGAVMLFITGGGFLTFIGVCYASYEVWPMWSFWPSLGGPEAERFFVGQIDLYMRFTLLMASPVIFTCFLVDFGMGLMNRFAPNLNVFFLAMPIKCAVALFILLLYLDVLFLYFKRGLGGQPEMIQYLQKLLS
ncbi:MAG: type III secretion system export apparatus subunit SctT [Planctomycetaceae bacterium]|nr:type III secretion system export apparatus subunit SctT [Planctomycetaceae bacterium]